MAAAAYLLQASVAIATGRHLFGDGSWLLLRLLAENHITHLNNNTWNDFFVGRLGSFSYQQFPTLLAARLGVRSLKVLSVVFGVTLFSFKPLSILLCYRFARDKRYVLFPLLSLFAGTMNSEGYVISETHLMSALFWAALFGLLYPREFRWFDLAAMIIVSAPLILCYETMALFGLVLVGACIYRRRAIAKSQREKWLTFGFGVWYSLGSDLRPAGDHLSSRSYAACGFLQGPAVRISLPPCWGARLMARADLVRAGCAGSSNPQEDAQSGGWTCHHLLVGDSSFHSYPSGIDQSRRPHCCADDERQCSR